MLCENLEDQRKKTLIRKLQNHGRKQRIFIIFQWIQGKCITKHEFLFLLDKFKEI